MQNTSPSSSPLIPSVLLVLDAFGEAIVSDVESIFLRDNARQRAVTAKLTLATPDEWLPVSPPSPADAAATPADDGNEDVAWSQDTLPQWRHALQQAIHRLRTYERLQAAGLESEEHPSLDVFILADMTNPATARVLLSILPLVEETLANDPYAEAYALLSIAHFDDETRPEVAARVWPLLQQLQSLQVEGAITPSSSPRVPYPALSTHLVLFDTLKEGGQEVADAAELRIIVGNVLIALLSGGLARELTSPTLRTAMLEQQAPFHSAAAAIVVFQPQPVIAVCAARLGEAFVRKEVLGESVPAAHVISGWLAAVQRDLGDLPTWMTVLVADTEAEIRTPEGPYVVGLHFVAPSFDGVPPEQWADAIREHNAAFVRNKLHPLQETITENARRLLARKSAYLDETIAALPQRPEFYPAGLRTARLALKDLATWLKNAADAVSAESNRAPLHLETRLRTLDRAAHDIPLLPAFGLRLLLLGVLVFYTVDTLVAVLWPHLPVAPLPAYSAGLVASLLTLAAGTLWLQRKERHLVALRGACIQASEMVHAHVLTTTAREQLELILSRLQEQVAQADEALLRLEALFVEMPARLHPDQSDFPTGSSPFRLPAADRTVVDWAYRHWQIPVAEMRRPLLQEHHLLANWRELDGDELYERLMAFGRAHFAPIATLSLSEVLRHRQDKGRGLLSPLPHSAMPLLRPNFDRLGGGRYAVMGCYTIVPAGEEALLVEEPSTSSSCQARWGESARLLACCRLRHLIPLAALQSLAASESLSASS